MGMMVCFMASRNMLKPYIVYDMHGMGNNEVERKCFRQ